MIRTNYKPETNLADILWDAWSRNFTMSQVLIETASAGFIIDESLVIRIFGLFDKEMDEFMKGE